MAGILLASALWMTWRSWKSSVPLEKTLAQPGLILKNINYTKTRHGRALWTLSAERAEHNQETGITLAHKIRLVFHHKEHGDILLTADKGRICSSNGTIQVMGNVRVENRPDAILTTSHLAYNEETGTITTDAPVHAVIQDSIINGKGLVLDTKEKIIHVLSDVNATIEAEPAPEKAQ